MQLVSTRSQIKKQCENRYFITMHIWCVCKWLAF
jgi:hypothetical protein